MFIKFKNLRINFDCVQSYYSSYSESTQKYYIDICYSNSVDDDDRITLQTKEELNEVLKKIDEALKTIDTETKKE